MLSAFVLAFLSVLPVQSATGALAVPKSDELRAVPLYELYGNSDIYGPMLDAIPQLLSRYNLNCITGQPMITRHLLGL